jgi:hypothetical protein
MTYSNDPVIKQPSSWLPVLGHPIRHPSANSVADTLALVTLPSDLNRPIIVDCAQNNAILDRAFWNAEGLSVHLTIPRFVGEFKWNVESLNKNQSFMDMATF